MKAICIFDNNVTVKTLTRSHAAATGQFIMIPQLISNVRMSVIWIYVYQTSATIKRLPVDSDTARLKFTRPLTFFQCGGGCVILAARCKSTFVWNPRVPAADVG